ncbi:MAG: bifunctional metallophosphatase/5'-nucleotidase [Myxococcales bacterium]|nr:bifunctional metallophosphatase/5'-nucleotidase [Myxococcales bacterium]
MRRAAAPHLFLAWATLLTLACETQMGAPPPNPSQPVQLTFVHSSDWHSRLLPYDFQIAATDTRLIERYAPDSPILKSTSDLVQIGGLTRFATLLKRERKRTPNVVWVDSGDCFQGAPIFNAFGGEVETRALSFLGADAVVLGNHEFDRGLDNLARQYGTWATFPILAANYLWDRDVKGAEEMARITRPYTIVNSGGLKIAVIGMANLSSLNSAGEGNNSLGFTPLDEVQTLQFYIDQLQGSVDLITVTSHLGLSGHEGRNEDYEIITQTCGLDLVFGGHLHVVLDPPQVRRDKCGRSVVLTHSGAFQKYMGRLDVVVGHSGDAYYGHEVLSHRYDLFPLDESVPEDPETAAFLEPYILDLNRQFDLTRIIAYAPRMIPRFGREKANAELGNIAAESMADRRGVQADFALTNTLGIRTDIIRGPITQDQMFNVFPFDNFVTKMFLSGREICEVMTFVARRSAGRGCQPQAQFSDRVHVTLNCITEDPECSFASEVAVRDQRVFDVCIDAGRPLADCDVEARAPIDELRIYEVAVNDYISRGGSGFRALKFNNARVPTDISIRDAVSDRFQSYPTCAASCLSECGVQADPAACRLKVETALEKTSLSALTPADCESLPNCYADVSAYHERFCEGRAEQDPRDFCDAVDAVNLPDDPVLKIAALGTFCAQIRARQQTQPADAPFPDECYFISKVVEVAGLLELPLDRTWAGAQILLAENGLPMPSDRCICRMEALIEADAECRSLSCVVGRADDRMETRLFGSLADASMVLSSSETQTDACVRLARVDDCGQDPCGSIEDLDEIADPDRREYCRAILLGDGDESSN